jgi:membrane fusion protein, multidrug efflux system
MNSQVMIMVNILFRFSAFTALSISVAAAIGCKGAKEAPPLPPPPLVTVASPVSYKVQHYLEYNGFLDHVDMVQIKARVKGFLVDIKFKDGEEVQEKDLLYRIDDREYQASAAKSKANIARANADIENAKAQIKLAEAELERTKKSVASGVGSKSDQDKAEAQLAANLAQLDTAKANVKAAEAALQMDELNLEYTVIRAPIKGQISRTLVTKGNIVGQNELTLLTTIVWMDELYVYFDIPERDLVEYQQGLKGKNSPSQSEGIVQVGVATEDGFPHIGKIDFRENRVEPGTGTIRIRGRIPNPLINKSERLLYPGLYAHVRLPVGEPEARPVIPEEALMTGQEGRFVYVIGAEDKVEKRTVEVGPQVWSPNLNVPDHPVWSLIKPASGNDKEKSESVQSMVAIEKGLKVGERIIVKGLQKARPGAPVTPDVWNLQELVGRKKAQEAQK